MHSNTFASVGLRCTVLKEIVTQKEHKLSPCSVGSHLRHCDKNSFTMILNVINQIFTIITM